MREMNRMSSIRGQLVIFTKAVANRLIKEGFVLREIGGKRENIYYFDDTEEIRGMVQAILEDLENR